MPESLMARTKEMPAYLWVLSCAMCTDSGFLSPPFSGSISISALLSLVLPVSPPPLLKKMCVCLFA